MKIYLVRHGQSEANRDKNLHHSLADHAIPLSDDGHKQALAAGKFFGERFYSEYGICPKIEMSEIPIEKQAELIVDSMPRIRMWLSPYERTRQTSAEITRGINHVCQQRGDINVLMDQREDIRLCEQQFGLFDGIPDDERHVHYPAEAAHYKKCEDQGGHFWARMPLGESRFDVANRVHEAFGTFHRDNDRHGIDTIIVVCHGVTLRAFVMQWLALTPEWFNDEPNPGNCDIRLIDGGFDMGYIYHGKLND
jgi:2,3-bisphosphoglycerate-dependent phosphoglycerate mutase